MTPFDKLIFQTMFAHLQADIYRNAFDKGFWSDFASMPEEYWYASKLALVHSEVSEAVEELRLMKSMAEKKEAVTEELADVVIRVMDLAAGMNLDLAKAIVEKHERNKSRPPKHGKSF